MGDFNIDFKNKGAGFDKLSEMCDSFNLTNLIKSETCYTKNDKSLIDFFFSRINLCLFKKLMSRKLVLVIISNSFPHFSNRNFQKLGQRL